MATNKKKGGISPNKASQPENTVKLDKPRKDEVGCSGVYPFTSSRSPTSAGVRTAGSWGQGERGGKGSEDHGGLELSYPGWAVRRRPGRRRQQPCGSLPVR
jgi:hypothetical protein